MLYWPCFRWCFFLASHPGEEAMAVIPKGEILAGEAGIFS